MDDIFVIGHTNQFDSLLNDLRADLKVINLKICDRKCEKYLPSFNEYDENCFSVPVVASSVKILGVPVGCDSYVQSRCIKTAATGEALCSQLLTLNDPQSALLLLRYCHVPTLNYLARCVSPTVLQEASHFHDQILLLLLGLNSLDEFAWQQVSLKIKLGGFGITALNQTSAAAFVSSWCHSLCEVPRRCPSRVELCDSLTECTSPPPFYHHLCEAVATLPSTLAFEW